MKYRVIKILPQGNAPGTIVELNADEARVLQLPGIEAVELLDDDEPAAASAGPSKRRYTRRDLQATES